MALTAVHEFLARLLRSRRSARHFRRRALLETLARTGVSREPPATLAQSLVAAATCDAQVLLGQLGSHSDGLTDEQAELIRERVGLNEV